eukprot:316416_1
MLNFEFEDCRLALKRTVHLTPTASFYLQKHLVEERKSAKNENDSLRILERNIKENYIGKYTKCVHYIYHSQEAFLSSVLIGDSFPDWFYGNNYLMEINLCINCSIKLWIKSNKLKYFISKLTNIINNKHFDIHKIQPNNALIVFTIILLIILNQPPIIKLILESSENPRFIFQIIDVIYNVYSEWIKVLKPKEGTKAFIFDKNKKDKTRHKYISYWTLTAIDFCATRTLRGLIYKLNRKLLKYFIFDVKSGEYFKKNVFNMFETTLKEGDTNWVQMTHSLPKNVSIMWWKKVYRNKSFIFDILQNIYGLYYDKSKRQVTRRNMNKKQYAYCQDLFRFLTIKPRKFLGISAYMMDNYRAPYMKLRQQYIICGNICCQIGYFEHKYDNVYYDGSKSLTDFAFHDHEKEFNDIRNDRHKPPYVWKLLKVRKWYLCKKCKMVYYCSRKCQKMDWNTKRNSHKIICKIAQKMYS